MRERYVPIRHAYRYQYIISILHQIFRKPSNVIFCHCDPLHHAEAETPRRQAMALMPSLMGCRPSRPAPITTTVARASRPEATFFSSRQGAYRFLRARWPFSHESNLLGAPRGVGSDGGGKGGALPSGTMRVGHVRGACGPLARPRGAPREGLDSRESGQQGRVRRITRPRLAQITRPRLALDGRAPG